MKQGKLILLLLCNFLAATLLVQNSYGQGYLPKPKEELYGTWANSKSVNAFQIQKMFIKAGSFFEFGGVFESAPRVEVTYQIDRKWTDGKSDLWYAIFGKINTGPWKGRNFKALEKLSKSSTILEMVVNAFNGDFSTTGYPDKIERNSTFNGGYRLFYRVSE